MFEILKQKYYQHKLQKLASKYSVTEDGLRLQSYCLDKLKGETYTIAQFDELLEELADAEKMSVEEVMSNIILFIDYFYNLKRRD